MLAAVIAVACNGPMCCADIARRITVVFLLIGNFVAALALADDAVLFDDRNHIADFLLDEGKRQIDFTVAQLQGFHFDCLDKDRIAGVFFDNCIGELLPSAQKELFVQFIKPQKCKFQQRLKRLRMVEKVIELKYEM